MKISPVGITCGELRVEPNGSNYNAYIGGSSRISVSKEEAILFFDENTTPNQKADKNAVIEWLSDKA